MKRNWIWSGLISLVLTASAFAAPSYDSKDWQSFMEGKSTTVPAGVPSGNGAVGAWHGKGFWADTGLVDIYNAIDASKLTGIAISDAARNSKRYYVGETGNAFLKALVDETRNLSNDKTLNIPVFYMSYQGDGVPRKIFNDQPGQNVVLGLYVRNKAGKSEPMPNAAYRSDHITVSQTIPGHQNYERYHALTAPKRASYQGMNQDELRAAMKSDRESLRSQNAGQQQEIAALEAQITAELGDELDELSPEERTVRVREEIMKRMDVDPNAQNKDDLQLDEEKTWLMIEAALTQKIIPVTRITMGTDLRARLIAYAASHKRPQSVIDRLVERSQETHAAARITIYLGCSLRDRFLGCKERDDATDALVNARAKTMLKAAENLTGDAQIQVLTMVWLSGADRINAESEALNQKLNPRDNKEARSLLNKIRMNQRVDASELTAICKSKTASPNDNHASALIGNRAPKMIFFSFPKYLMTPDEMAKLPGTLAGMDDNCREQFVRTAQNVTTMLHTENPAVAPYILQHFNSLVTKQNTKELQIKRLNVAMADLLVYEMPQNLTTLTDAIAYWQKIVNETNGKSKDDLVRAAMKRAKIKLPNATLESVANVDSIAAQMPTLVQNTPVLAVNLHRVAERTLHSNIPQSRQSTNHYSGQFEKWWETNKPLYVPRQLVHNENYDRYKSFYRPHGMNSIIKDAQTPSAVVKPAAVPAKPAAKKPQNQKGKKVQDNASSALLRKL
jgi:hypothetical protein